MKRFRLTAAAAVSILAVVAAAAGGVVAASQSSDEQALRPTRGPADRRIESRVNHLLSKMTLEEKLEQIQLLPDFLVTEAEVRQGLGSVLSVTDPARIRELQTIAVEQSRLKIPLLFAFDTIHGFRTVFPIPLAAGASFDPQVAFDDHKYGARESAAVGLKQTYAPMVDVSHEPRWGRISEAAGEDPYLNSVLAAARVKAIQGRDYSAPDKLVASPKHFAAYGQPEAGRDYNTTDMSIQRLWNFYLPPFKAAIDAGADTAMCSFNAINGVPGCGNDYLMNEILKDEWNFDGFVEGDWTAVAEMRACPPVNPNSGECGHGVAADGPGAAELALESGVDSEMTSTLIRDFGEQLLRERRISMKRIDDAVRRILRVKFRAGLFENPYAPYTPAEAEAQMLRPDAVAAAKKAASRSMVLLRNEGGILPLDPSKKTAVIGPLAKNQHDMLGPWWGAGRDTDVVTVFDGINTQSPGATYAEGCKLSNTEPPHTDPEGCGSEAGFAEAVAVARAADQVVLALGETREMSGEAAARSTLDLPGRQEELIARDQGDREALCGRAVQWPPARARGRDRRHAGAPRGVVPGRPGGPCGRRRGVRQGQPGRQAARVVPAPSRPGADLLQPRADRTAVQPGREVELAAPRHPVLLAALRVRLRAQLHDVRDLEPPAQLVVRVEARKHQGVRDREEHRQSSGGRGRAALHSRPGREHLAAGPPTARVRAGDADPGPVPDAHVHARQERLRLLRRPRQARRRAGADRRLRRVELGRDAQEVVHRTELGAR